MLTVNSILSKYTKNRQKRQSTKQNLPWFTKTIWEMMKKRDMALKAFLKSGLTTDRFNFTSQRNKVTAALRKAKAGFFLEIIKNAQGNSRIIWKTINKLLGKEKSKSEDIHLKINGNIINDSLAIATNFNHYFLDAVKKRAENFNSAYPTSVINNNSNLILCPTNTIKVEKKNHSTE